MGSEVAQYPKLRSLLMPAFQMGTTSDDSSEDDLLHMEKNSETTLDTEYPSSELNITPLEASAGCVSQRESQRSNESELFWLPFRVNCTHCMHVAHATVMLGNNNNFVHYLSY